MNLYVHITDDEKRKEVEKIEQVLNVVWEILLVGEEIGEVDGQRLAGIPLKI